jgi:Tfp pilus assembly protein PilX
MNGTTSRKCHSKQKPKGFALIISLSLMVLLTILAVGLLGLSSISLRASTRGEAVATARANARVALMFAIGELQKQAGPDQRITATADMAGAADGSRLSAGAAPGNNVPLGGTNKGLTSVQNGTRYWTGVWSNANTNNPGTTIYTRTPAPAFRKWLVSGNESSATGSSAFTPASNDMAVGGDGSVNDQESAVVLAGLNTIGGSSGDSAERFVSAPLVAISAPSSLADHPIGRHAWWVADEGVKAKLNMMDTTPSGGDLTYEKLAGPRRGWEAVEGFGNYPTRDGASQAVLGKVITLPEAGLMDGSLASSASPALGRAFHAATTESFGVLTDALQGGLKLDLTAYLTSNMPTTSPTAIPNGIAAGNNIIPTSVANRIRGPKWQQLRDFYEMGQEVRQQGTLRAKAASQITDAAIAPVVVDFRVLMGVKLAPTATGATDFKIQPCAKLAISLANPYPYPLTWSGMDLEFKCETHPSRLPSRIYGLSGSAAAYPAVLPRVNTQFVPQEASVLGNAIFQIPSTTLQPGEARAFTVGGPVLRPASSMARVTVAMTPFSSGNPSDFRNCVILDTNTTASAASGFTLDIREDTTTSQASLELRETGSTSAIYRRVERFELDNAPFAASRRTFNSSNAAQFTAPVPLQYYGFQLSQPGMDYAAILPAANQLGLRSSTMRTFMDFNLQATRFRKPIISYNPPPYFMLIADSVGMLPFSVPGGNTGLEFTKNLITDPLPWGRSPFDSPKTVLFSPPASLVSLAQFQHADLTADDDAVSIGHQPGNAVGNSYASPFLPRANTTRSRSDFTIESTGGATAKTKTYYDMSYLLNAALWDTYFFSTIPAAGGAIPENKCMVPIQEGDQSAAIRDGALAASRLLVNGAHNVNCTEKDAWVALLASSKSLQHKADDSESGDAMFPRSLEQLSGSATPPSGTGADSFSGFRRLSDAQIDALATAITKQVRQRGPFVSLSQFVNRSIASLTQGKEAGRSGALQSAIDESGLNVSADGSKSIFSSPFDVAEDRMNLQRDGSKPRADMAGGDGTSLQDSGTDGQWPPTSFDENPGAVAGILADKPMLTDARYRPEQGFRSTGIPGWLTQADLLQAIGPALTVRSDTFRIRAYGEATDPETGIPTARAWCEAVVQRLPEYIDGGDAVDERPEQLQEVNQRFGRRFQLVSFKWLSPDEI